MPLTIGSLAPDFELKDQDGNTVKLSSFKGQKVVVYFYPKDMTSGCTLEACEFSLLYDRIKRRANLFGIRKDSADSHKKFIIKNKLPFPLLVDDKQRPDADGRQRTVAEKYGAWGEKQMYGKIYDGIIRKTFIIDEQGKIMKIFPKVNPLDHAKEVLEAVLM